MSEERKGKTPTYLKDTKDARVAQQTDSIPYQESQKDNKAKDQLNLSVKENVKEKRKAFEINTKIQDHTKPVVGMLPPGSPRMVRQNSTTQVITGNVKDLINQFEKNFYKELDDLSKIYPSLKNVKDIKLLDSELSKIISGKITPQDNNVTVQFSPIIGQIKNLRNKLEANRNIAAKILQIFNENNSSLNVETGQAPKSLTNAGVIKNPDPALSFSISKPTVSTSTLIQPDKEFNKTVKHGLDAMNGSAYGMRSDLLKIFANETLSNADFANEINKKMKAIISTVNEEISKTSPVNLGNKPHPWPKDLSQFLKLLITEENGIAKLNINRTKLEEISKEYKKFKLEDRNIAGSDKITKVTPVLASKPAMPSRAAPKLSEIAKPAIKRLKASAKEIALDAQRKPIEGRDAAVRKPKENLARTSQTLEPIAEEKRKIPKRKQNMTMLAEGNGISVNKEPNFSKQDLDKFFGDAEGPKSFQASAAETSEAFKAEMKNRRAGITGQSSNEFKPVQSAAGKKFIAPVKPPVEDKKIKEAEIKPVNKVKEAKKPFVPGNLAITGKRVNIGSGFNQNSDLDAMEKANKIKANIRREKEEDKANKKLIVEPTIPNAPKLDANKTYVPKKPANNLETQLQEKITERKLAAPVKKLKASAKEIALDTQRKPVEGRDAAVRKPKKNLARTSQALEPIAEKKTKISKRESKITSIDDLLNSGTNLDVRSADKKSKNLKNAGNDDFASRTRLEHTDLERASRTNITFDTKGVDVRRPVDFEPLQVAESDLPQMQVNQKPKKLEKATLLKPKTPISQKDLKIQLKEEIKRRENKRTKTVTSESIDQDIEAKRLGKAEFKAENVTPMVNWMSEGLDERRLKADGESANVTKSETRKFIAPRLQYQSSSAQAPAAPKTMQISDIRLHLNSMSQPNVHQTITKGLDSLSPEQRDKVLDIIKEHRGDINTQSTNAKLTALFNTQEFNNPNLEGLKSNLTQQVSIGNFHGQTFLNCCGYTRAEKLIDKPAELDKIDFGKDYRNPEIINAVRNDQKMLRNGIDINAIKQANVQAPASQAQQQVREKNQRQNLGQAQAQERSQMGSQNQRSSQTQTIDKQGNVTNIINHYYPAQQPVMNYAPVPQAMPMMFIPQPVMYVMPTVITVIPQGSAINSWGGLFNRAQNVAAFDMKTGFSQMNFKLPETNFQMMNIMPIAAPVMAMQIMPNFVTMPQMSAYYPVAPLAQNFVAPQQPYVVPPMRQAVGQQQQVRPQLAINPKLGAIGRDIALHQETHKNTVEALDNLAPELRNNVKKVIEKNKNDPKKIQTNLNKLFQKESAQLVKENDALQNKIAKSSEGAKKEQLKVEAGSKSVQINNINKFSSILLPQLQHPDPKQKFNAEAFMNNAQYNQINKLITKLAPKMQNEILYIVNKGGPTIHDVHKNLKNKFSSEKKALQGDLAGLEALNNVEAALLNKDKFNVRFSVLAAVAHDFPLNHPNSLEQPSRSNTSPSVPKVEAPNQGATQQVVPAKTDKKSVTFGPDQVREFHQDDIVRVPVSQPVVNSTKISPAASLAGSSSILSNNFNASITTKQQAGLNVNPTIAAKTAGKAQQQSNLAAEQVSKTVQGVPTTQAPAISNPGVAEFTANMNPEPRGSERELQEIRDAVPTVSVVKPTQASETIVTNVSFVERLNEEPDMKKERAGSSLDFGAPFEIESPATSTISSLAELNNVEQIKFIEINTKLKELGEKERASVVNIFKENIKKPEALVEELDKIGRSDIADLMVNKASKDHKALKVLGIGNKEENLYVFNVSQKTLNMVAGLQEQQTATNVEQDVRSRVNKIITRSAPLALGATSLNIPTPPPPEKKQEQNNAQVKIVKNPDLQTNQTKASTKLIDSWKEYLSKLDVHSLDSYEGKGAEGSVIAGEFVINEVYKDGVLDNAKFKKGDIIDKIKVNSQDLSPNVKKIIEGKNIGDSVQIKIAPENNETLKVGTLENNVLYVNEQDFKDNIRQATHITQQRDNNKTEIATGIKAVNPKTAQPVSHEKTVTRSRLNSVNFGAAGLRPDLTPRGKRESGQGASR